MGRQNREKGIKTGRSDGEGEKEGRKKEWIGWGAR